MIWISFPDLIQSNAFWVNLSQVIFRSPARAKTS
jgi:hypothetical protein